MGVVPESGIYEAGHAEKRQKEAEWVTSDRERGTKALDECYNINLLSSCFQIMGTASKQWLCASI
jgi:hypothetical protein